MTLICLQIVVMTTIYLFKGWEKVVYPLWISSCLDFCHVFLFLNEINIVYIFSGHLCLMLEILVSDVVVRRVKLLGNYAKTFNSGSHRNKPWMTQSDN